MKEEIIKDETQSAQEINKSEETGNQPTTDSGRSTPKQKFAWILTAVIIAVIMIAGLAWIAVKKSATGTPVEAGNPKIADEKSAGQQSNHDEGESGQEIRLDAGTLASARLEFESVTQRPAVALLKTTGTIENNPQQTQQVSPLVGGRVENVTAAVGDYVRQGALLAVIASPEIAEMHGKLHESETRRALAERNLARVTRSENRVGVLQAKAKLDEATATLNRTKRLIELGAGAGKDLISAETNYKTAKADYDFQSNISLNKEIQEARAEAETDRVDVKHIRDQMRALGVNLAAHDAEDNHSIDTSKVPVYAPAAGMVTERPINPGVGIQAGTTLFVLSNLSSVYAVANVPETQMMLIRIGTGAEIFSPVLGTRTINARVAYIDPQLNEETRTCKVRLEVPNAGGTLRAGMFVEVGFQTSTSAASGTELVIPSDAIQRLGKKTVVFSPREKEPGAFEVREIEIGGESGGYARIKNGLEIGERIVTRGSFILKTQLQKSSMQEDN